MQVHYLEVVTPDVEAVCQAYSAMDDATFSTPQPLLGNARTTTLPGGCIVAVRAPLHESEEPTVRPYWLVADINAAVDSAVKSGAEIIHSPPEIPGIGTFAIYVLGKVHHGLWQK